MSRIRSKNTNPELLVRSFLHKKGFRFKLHDKNLPGKPDIVLLKYKTIIFVNGCFWHGHNNCNRFSMPKSRKNYWIPKIEKNINNFEKQKRKLKNLGWNIIVIWECQLKKSKIEKTFLKIFNRIKI